jgi:uncharacterized protein (TIGR03086 family)
MLAGMISPFDGIVDKYLLAGSEFATKLASVRPGQWTCPTPCTEWDVRQLANHMTSGNLNYVRLLDGATSEEFLRHRDAEALGADPVAAYLGSVRECATAFMRSGALRQILDYPLGKVTGRQALAIRTTDTVIHTWDLARAIGADDHLAVALVAWISDHLDTIYEGMTETPTSAHTTHRFFAPPAWRLPAEASQQDRLLHRMGRRAGSNRLRPSS